MGQVRLFWVLWVGRSYALLPGSFTDCFAFYPQAVCVASSVWGSSCVSRLFFHIDAVKSLVGLLLAAVPAVYAVATCSYYSGYCYLCLL